MNSRQKTVLKNLLAKRFALLRWLMMFLLVLGLTSCGEKAVSQDVSVGYGEQPQPISKQFSEVSPPDTIQDLQSALEVYQPQVTILTPQPDVILQENQVTVRLQVKDLPIFQDQQFQLGSHLEVILDNQPYQTVYDLSQPLVLSDLSPGTHTLRVFASRPWDESFKNEGAYAQTTFHIFAKTDENNPDPTLPLLTYNSPRGNYGAEPILLDFYLTNAPLHLLGVENSQNDMSDWRIRCTINGESFVFDRWQAIYLKGFKPGDNWVKLEFLDNQGNPVKNAFNTTVRLIKYQPSGKDTLSKIIRGELKADDVRSIVDQSYTAKPPIPEPTPEIPKVVQPEPTELQPEVTPTPQVTESPIPEPQPQVTPTPQATESPTPEPQPQVTPTPQATESPTLEAQPQVTPTPEPQAEAKPTPEVTESPEPQPQVTPTPEAKEVPEELETQSLKSRLSKYFQRSPLPTPSEVTPIPQTTESLEPQPEVTPTPEATESPEKQETK
jgi:hypothetical protein